MIYGKIGKTKHIIKKFFLYSFLIVWSLIVFFPIVQALSSSLKAETEIFKDLGFVPENPTLENYKNIVITHEYRMYFINTLLVTVVSSLLTVFFALTAGYGFSRFNIKLRKVWITIILLCQMFPHIMLVIPYFKLMNSMGLFDTYAALIISRVVIFLPFSLLLLKSFFDALPYELEEAGLVDGCTRIGIFMRISAPLALPGIATVIVFTFMRGWNEYLFSLALTQSKMYRMITVALASFVQDYDVNWASIMSMSFLSLLPSVLLFILMQKHVIKGLTAGAVKS